MLTRAWWSAILCIILALPLAAQTGKIAGRITDQETGEPLMLVNVVIAGTSRGAATNDKGEYVILDVPVGKVTLVASILSHQKMTVRDILVKSGETSVRDFSLTQGTSTTLKEVVIEWQRPLVDVQSTNSKETLTMDDIENMPVRSVEGLIGLQAGVVSTGGGLSVRGGRPDETGYIVDGITVNNPLFGGRSLSLITNAIAEMNLQSGGYSAEFGGANAGIAGATTRSGGSVLRVEAETYTDHWAEPGNKTLGTYSTGSSVHIVTVGGPVYGPVKFFVAGQNAFSRTPASGFQYAYNLTDVFDPLLRGTAAHALLTPEEQAKTGIFDPQQGSAAKKIDYRFPGGMLLNAASESWTGNGNLTADLGTVRLRLGGSYARGSGRGGAGLTTKEDERRAGISESEDYSVTMKGTHFLSKSTFYELYLGYLGNFGVSMDNDHRHNIYAYGDSIANAQYGYTFRGDGIPQLPTTMFGASFVPFGYPLAGYAKSSFTSIQAKLNMVHQIGRTHEIKTGGEVMQYRIRSFGIDAFGLKQFLRENPDATALEIAGSSGTNYYGYDMYGKPVDSGPDGPKTPVFAAFYALDKIELQDLVINVGIRYDYINTNAKEFVDPHNIHFTPEGLIDQSPSNLRDVTASQTISPRLGFSFPVTDKTVFYAQYGKFVQQSRLRDVYLGNAVISSNIKGGYAVSSPVGFGLRPERTTQYDFGFRQQIGENFAFDIGAYYRDIRDLIQQRQVTASPGAEHPAYYAWVNGDFATTSGVSLKMDLRRVERVQLSIDYTYSDARGTGSSPSSAFRALWLTTTETPFLPKYPMLLDFDVKHKGSLNFDYRFGGNDGPDIFGVKALERMGANLLFTFNSGRPYTRVSEFSFGDRRTPVEAINSSRTPWVFQLDGRIDKTVEIGPFNLNVYVWVINVLNIKNITGLYATSGGANDNGFLATDEGRNRIANYAAYDDVFGELYKEFYRQSVLMNANVYGAPRRIYLGLRVNF
ncbi:MAG: TonB-dependent receptor [Ignavibacteria bacterium]|nr:TonB-dependent receptor [Ignavibacteria bacterium]